MPIFQDDLRGHQHPPPEGTSLTSAVGGAVHISRKVSEESTRTELYGGPLVDVPNDLETTSSRNLDSSLICSEHGTSDPAELIQCLKRRGSPTWLPNRNFKSLLHGYRQETPRKTSSTASNSSPLLPPAEISGEKSQTVDIEHHTQAGLNIERPRSALHSGDFTLETQPDGNRGLLGTNSALYSSGQQPWVSTSPPRNFSSLQLDTQLPPIDQKYGPRSRAPSLSSSYSSSFVLKPPTSPLVQSESNEDLDFASNLKSINITPDLRRAARRHTLEAPHSVLSNPSLSTAAAINRPFPSLRRDTTYPYQAHQPRRSLTFNSPVPQLSCSPQTPLFLRSRRPSYTLDSSPLHHASMVGSYEESILRGRMSTTPSKPIDFVAQIGVLGLGKCKSSLRCPAHVTIPFPAVFYSYETTSHGRAGKGEDGPSPYVGQIDLENNLPSQDVSRDVKRKRHSSKITKYKGDDLDMIDTPSTALLSEREMRKAERLKRRSTSPRAPLGGSYRIPEKGQLQIIIKNPNKTAVKLFLVPYDLTGMEPGTKTFIRQRSYSTGPIIDSALSSSPSVSVSSPLDRPTLRYLVHLHICSPSRGRFYLYRSIRVVFANRVPDGKENLRNEISLPEPRFSVYKPGRESTISLVNGAGSGASLAAEKAFRRRSSGFAPAVPHTNIDSMDGIEQSIEKGLGGGSLLTNGHEYSVTPVQPIPLTFSQGPRRPRADSAEDRPNNLLLQTSGSRPSTSQEFTSSISWNSNSDTGDYGKLNKGDIGYGGNIFGGSPDGKPFAAEGLLARKLRDLGVGMPSQQDRLDGM